MITFKSNSIAIYGAEESMQGGRSENQDDFGYMETPVGLLIIICDGMGGGPGGKIASSTVKNQFFSDFCSYTSTTPLDHAFKKASNNANNALELLMRANPSLVGMGSTFVALLINKTSAFIANAGDSRCYQIRKNKIIFRSNDHSLVAELIRNKALTEEEARVSPQSNIITRGLGSTSNHVPEIYEVSFRKGDRFVMCTDGVWGSMPQKDLLSRITSNPDPAKVVNAVSSEVDHIGFAKGGGHDNHTLAIIDVEEDSTLKKSSFIISKKDMMRVVVYLSAIFILISGIFTAYHILDKKGDNKNISLPNSSGFIPGNNDGNQPRSHQERQSTTSDNYTSASALDENRDAENQENDEEDGNKATQDTDGTAENTSQTSRSDTQNKPDEHKTNKALTPEIRREYIINGIIAKLDTIKNVRIPKKGKAVQSTFNTAITSNLDSISRLVKEYSKYSETSESPTAISYTEKLVKNTNGWISTTENSCLVLAKEKKAAIDTCIIRLKKLQIELRNKQE